MIKSNQKILNMTLILLDGLICAATMIGAYLLRFANYSGAHLGLGIYLRLLVPTVPVYALLYHLLGLHESFRYRGFLTEAGKIIQANLLGLMFLQMLAFLGKEIHLSRMVLMLFFAMNTAASGVMRYLLRRVLRRMRSGGRNQKHFLIVGWNEMAEDLCKKLIGNKSLGCYIDAYLGSGTPSGKLSFLPRAGRIQDLEKYLACHTPDEVVLCLEYEQYPQLQHLLEVCEKYGVKSSLLPLYAQYLPSRLHIEEIEGIPLMDLRHIPLDEAFNRVLKRGTDIILSLGGLVFLSPFLLLVALLVKASSPGPVLYSQERVGLNRRTFQMYKFRSMRADDSGRDKTAWSTSTDDRRTPIGAFLRKFSIDELPQLYNVLRGDMSIVGPRPELPFFVDKFKEEVPMYMLKHLVRPGITGWAQVQGWRGDTSITQRIKCDLYYIESWSFLLDIKIIFMTAFCMFNRSEKLGKAAKARQEREEETP